MKIVVLTSNPLRHRYFVNHLNAHFPLAAVGVEKFLYTSPSPANAEEREAWDWFFQRRQAYEIEMFGPSDALPAKNIPWVFRIRPDELNSAATANAIAQADPDLIIVYGTGLLGPRMVETYGGKILNLHVGLPEYCRGSGCNFWPIYNERLDRLGAAVHLVDRGIDTGKVLLRGTIELEDDDDEQSLTGKVLLLGTRLMIDAIRDWKSGTIIPQSSNEKGRLYWMKDFTPEKVLGVKTMVESGRLKELIRSCK